VAILEAGVEQGGDKRVSEASLTVAAILLIAVPTVEFGGMALLRMNATREPGYMDNPLRQNLFRAGHAHAGVWIVFALVAMLLVDQTGLTDGWQMVVRLTFAAAPILMPLGFFLSVASPQSTAPNNLVALVYLGGLSLGVGAVTLGIGLLLR
jgi:hypothetical protein